MVLDFRIRETTADDWRDVRELRLEMLADTPLAFLERLPDARAHGEAVWRARGERGYLAAIDASGRWLGTMGWARPRDGEASPVLVGVYVTPSARGRDAGVADALLAGVEEEVARYWDRILLEVNEENPRAIAFYERHGYEPTGEWRPYPLDPRQRELEMAKRLLR
ncbi:GNAT family N-acetyltransferase [Homoserinibacter sp. YIM 151385]|uniref:GNAT family N-acetyltransferase n=1 Tax=Homoserinibacter sp. YIM 151385 TaxID=2985506 RepID=UPI0022F14505|nr:GNAT family N-acetyltransferase [Homoserinibacter sp. YIM 151385]WBU36980.1 GNAT family N-acetyltransferase [Homoserinibacter sp. YIM 151385]